jgi:predicted nucleic acid-binding protein
MGRGDSVRAVLDANVLYSAFLRDVLLRLAAAELFRPYWSERIHDEWIRNLLAHRPDLSSEKLFRTRAGMDAFFPDALVTGHEALEAQFGGVAPTDRHVAAAALKAGAGQIVTQNVRDFPPSALLPHGIVATAPDEFVQMLVGMDSPTVRAALEQHRLGLNRPALSLEEYQAAFMRNGLSRSAALLWP